MSMVGHKAILPSGKVHSILDSTNTWIALLSTSCILTYLCLRFLTGMRPPFVDSIGRSRCTGGVPLIWDLSRRLVHLEFGSDLLRGNIDRGHCPHRSISGSRNYHSDALVARPWDRTPRIGPIQSWQLSTSAHQGSPTSGPIRRSLTSLWNGLRSAIQSSFCRTRSLP